MADHHSRSNWSISKATLLLSSILLLLIVSSGCNADNEAAAAAAQDDFSSIRSSPLDLATWIKQGFEHQRQQVAETKERSVCLGSSLLHLLLQLIAKTDAEVALRQLTDEQLQVLCSILCGLGICPPGCPENSNPCPWGCGPDR